MNAEIKSHACLVRNYINAQWEIKIIPLLILKTSECCYKKFLGRYLIIDADIFD